MTPEEESEIKSLRHVIVLWDASNIDTPWIEEQARQLLPGLPSDTGLSVLPNDPRKPDRQVQLAAALKCGTEAGDNYVSDKYDIVPASFHTPRGDGVLIRVLRKSTPGPNPAISDNGFVDMQIQGAIKMFKWPDVLFYRQVAMIQVCGVDVLGTGTPDSRVNDALVYVQWALQQEKERLAEDDASVLEKEKILSGVLQNVARFPGKADPEILKRVLESVARSHGSAHLAEPTSKEALENKPPVCMSRENDQSAIAPSKKQWWQFWK